MGYPQEHKNKILRMKIADSVVLSIFMRDEKCNICHTLYYAAYMYEYTASTTIYLSKNIK